MSQDPEPGEGCLKALAVTIWLALAISILWALDQRLDRLEAAHPELAAPKNP